MGQVTEQDSLPDTKVVENVQIASYHTTVTMFECVSDFDIRLMRFLVFFLGLFVLYYLYDISNRKKWWKEILTSFGRLKSTVSQFFILFMCVHLVFWGFKTTLDADLTQEKAIGEIFWGSM